MKKKALDEYIDSNKDIGSSALPPRSSRQTYKKYTDPEATAGAKDPQYTRSTYFEGEASAHEAAEETHRSLDASQIEQIVEDILSKKDELDQDHDVLPRSSVLEKSPRRSKIKIERQTSFREMKEMAATDRMEVMVRLLKLLQIDKLSNFEKRELIRFIKGQGRGL